MTSYNAISSTCAALVAAEIGSSPTWAAVHAAAKKLLTPDFQVIGYRSDLTGDHVLYVYPMHCTSVPCLEIDTAYECNTIPKAARSIATLLSHTGRFA